MKIEDIKRAEYKLEEATEMADKIKRLEEVYSEIYNYSEGRILLGDKVLNLSVKPDSSICLTEDDCSLIYSVLEKIIFMNLTKAKEEFRKYRIIVGIE